MLNYKKYIHASSTFLVYSKARRVSIVVSVHDSRFHSRDSNTGRDVDI